jgi:HK97 family phage major capsid protein
VQTADNAAVAETDLTDSSINAPVKTVSGQQDVAIQLLDQSPINFDEVIFSDLMADYATKVDLEVLAGSNTAGQVKGVHATPGITTIAISGITLTKFYGAVADAVQRVHTSRFLPPSHIVMHPRRWAWLTAQLDSQFRPLVLPAANSLQNALATLDAVGSQQVVGQLQGLPVVTDPNIGTAYGTGTNEDLAYVQRSSDLLLFESGIRTRVLPEVGSGTLTVRLQVYGYVAFSAERYPQSIVEISGLTAPTF